MKIIAVSEVPPKAPFVHLGYVAASFSRFYSKPAAGIGGLLVAASILGLVIVKALTPRKLKKKIGLEGTQSRVLFGLITTGGIIAALVFSWYGFAREWGRYAVTRDGLEQLSAMIHQRLEAGEEVPPDVESIRAQWGLNEEAVRDAWDRPIAYRESHPYWHEGDSLLSAGTDGRFDTGDDVLFLIETNPERRRPESREQPDAR